jgi:L-ascorbate metabolism protein UlaG (beta-lactamase superfamily)
MTTKSSSISSSPAAHAIVTTPDYTLPCPDDVKQLSHHKQRNQVFHNPWPSFVDPGGPAIAFKIMKRNLTGEANKPDTKNPAIDVLKPTFRALQSSATKADHSTVRATWLGHASYLLEFPSTSNNLTVLFDPVFTNRCSPLSFLGPARFTPAPCPVEDLPPIDVVVISHNHYDHMSYPTLTAIFARNPNVHFFVPLNLKKWFVTNGMGSNITEMDWWQSSDFTLPTHSSPTATFSCLPAQHATARTGSDRNTTLWCGWSITTHQNPTKSVYFVGDTGYRSIPEAQSDVPPLEDSKLSSLPVCPAFAQIGELRGPFDLAMIPIGAYAPRWLFSPLHGDPFDAVAICEDVKATKALAMHWGTWVLTEEDVTEPKVKLEEAVAAKGWEKGRFEAMAIGESREF